MEVSKQKNITFREIFSEFLGSLMYTFFEGFSVVMNVNSITSVESNALLVTAIFTVLYWTQKGTSACHFNPIITTACILLRYVSPGKGGIYILAQMLGSYVGSLMLVFYLPTNFEEMAESSSALLGCPHLNNDFSIFAGLIIEFLGPMFLTLIFLSVYANPELSDYTPCIGAAYGLFKLVGGGITGAALNPFRYFGPALVSLQMSDFYIYLFMPFVGAILSVFLFKFVVGSAAQKKKDEEMIESDNGTELIESNFENMDDSKIKRE